MERLGLYLRDFNREFLTASADRRRAGRILVAGFATVMLIFAIALLLLMAG